MNWAWTSSLDQIWRSPVFPMWLTLAAAGFFGIIVLVTLLRAEKTVANGALTVITLLAIAVAVAATIREFNADGSATVARTAPLQPASPSLPALSCMDDLAGDTVLNACEKALFASPESAAAAVAYAAAQISQLTSVGGVAGTEPTSTTELQALRKAVERDRYGLVAYVLTVRDHCTPQACPPFNSLGNSQQVASNMNDHVYETLIARYAPGWNAPPVSATAAIAGQVAALPPSMPTGKPTNAEFPSSANTPPVSIMTPEPAAPAPKPPGSAAPAPKPPASAAPAPRPAPPPATAAAKRPPAPKRPPAAPPAPVSVAPAPVAPVPVAPAASAPRTTSDE